MKKIIIFPIIFLFYIISFSQEKNEEFKPSGKGTGAVFFNYNYNTTEDANQKSSFVIDRAYLGYSYKYSKTISAKVLFDVGYDTNVKTYTAFAKNAMLDWNIDPKITMSIGLIGTKQFDTQEKFWGYRYIKKTFADQNGLGTSADLGINFEINPSEKIKFNLFVLNGEGFKSLQDIDGNHRLGINTVYAPVKSLQLKLHYDILPSKVLDENVTISNFVAFAGFQFTEKGKIGIEYNVLNNGEGFKKASKDKTLGGISTYINYQIDSKFDVFARYDKLNSNKINNALTSWNYNNDGSLYMIGVQYSPVKGVNTSINYQGWFYETPNVNDQTGIYMNFGFSF